MSGGAIPAPGSNERFTVRTLRIEDVDHWYRVYAVAGRSAGAGPFSFNKGWGNSRFAPIQIFGETAHTYYAASTLDCALLESVLHDVDLEQPSYFDPSLLVRYRVARFRLVEPLQFVSFHSHDLPRLGLSRTQLIESKSRDMAETRAWARAALEQRPLAQAIGYTSRRNDSGRCLMLLKQRLPDPPFELIDDENLGGTPHLRAAAVALASSLGIALT